MFSQCQAIHARSIFPCQDTPDVKATYDFNIKSPLPVIASGVAVGLEKSTGTDTALYKFEQKVPIPSYLFALASGDIAEARIGPISKVATSPDQLSACQWELEEATGKFLGAINELIFPYVWGEYNVLVLPPSFPYGGMENPVYTFATPTLISRDRENVDVIAHELAHSWSGNLVTAANWEHFWLNEGWTTYLERRIMAAVHGEPYRHFSAIIGWKALMDSVERYGAEHEFTRLVTDLKGKDPDDAFSTVPYEKGFVFLFHLENLVGKDKFDKFIPHYFTTYKQQSLDSFQFRDCLLAFFADDAAASVSLASVDFDHWFFAPGLPPRPDYDTSLVDTVYALAAKWRSLTTKSGSASESDFVPHKSDIDGLNANQLVVFLEQVLLFNKPLTAEHSRLMGNVYGFLSSQNYEVTARFYQVGLRAKDATVVLPTQDLLSCVGRMKHVRPLYRELVKFDRQTALETFKKNENFYHPICKNLSQDALKSTTAKPFLTRSQGEDHAVVQFHRLNHQRYPKDCPPLQVRWFYAVDVPKVVPSFWARDSETSGASTKPSKARGTPKKFVPFSIDDSKAIERTFQALAEREEAAAAVAAAAGVQSSASRTAQSPVDEDDIKSVTVPVNEDFLFDVNIRKRELGPAYWLGPIYEVRRGSWFFQDGSILKPCEENLAIQLEEGYLKIQPWKHEANAARSASNSVPALSTKDAKNATRRDDSSVASSPTSTTAASASLTVGTGSSASPSVSPGTTTPEASSSNRKVSATSTSGEAPTYRLFGAYMNNVVNYQDSTTAWLITDDFMSRIGSSVYTKLGGTAGTKLVRGCAEVAADSKSKEALQQHQQLQDQTSRTGARRTRHSPKSKDELARKRKSAPPVSLSSSASPDTTSSSADADITSASAMTPLERQMTSLYGSSRNAEEAEEAARAQEERAMDASRETKNDEPGREIDHLILVTHGIGQRLGQRMESINFVHDVNNLRKTLKNVYNAAPDLQALNSDNSKTSKNSRVQVLPICWRHLLDFPKRGLKKRHKEVDLADAVKPTEEAVYPSLADITLEGVPGVRNLITDLAMDVLLYQSGYREHIANIVTSEANRIYKIFVERNPGFQGTVSFCGHSLGSAIMFDILCHRTKSSRGLDSGDAAGLPGRRRSSNDKITLDFEVDSFFGLGSPIALFQMLRGKMIAAASDASARRSPEGKVKRSASSRGFSCDDDFDLGESSDCSDGCESTSLSTPHCKEFYNIFHPSDPISYRLEPLISPAMASLKPQPLPFIKRTIWSTPGQSLTTFSAKVGQSVGSLWSNFTSGVASSLLNRSLGISDEGSANASSQAKTSRSGSPAPGSTGQATTGGGTSTPRGEDPGADIAGDDYSMQKIPTLLDTNIETLYDGFQKSRMESMKKPSDYESAEKWMEAETQARRLRSEDAKVRALNSNGRVDYSIQEGAFDISLIASIASHLSYWSDEDVSHFIMSQLLSRSHIRHRSQ
ncbi:hypothetical protein KEM52_005496, partial [Ascosphaera acerosa]